MSVYKSLVGFAWKFFELVADQAKWSQITFGADSERGPVGALRYLELEARAAQARPGDVVEYANCLLLILDASRLAGFTPLQLVEAAQQKMEINKRRKWPQTPADPPTLHKRRVPELGGVFSDDWHAYADAVNGRLVETSHSIENASPPAVIHNGGYPHHVPNHVYEDAR